MGTLPVEPYDQGRTASGHTPKADNQERLALSDPQMETVVRSLAASVNLRMMDVLLEHRRSDPADGWMFLSQIAEALDEKPGTVGLAVQKLLPLLEEKREKGKRYFRSRYTDMQVLLATA